MNRNYDINLRQEIKKATLCQVFTRVFTIRITELKCLPCKKLYGMCPLTYFNTFVGGQSLPTFLNVYTGVKNTAFHSFFARNFWNSKLLPQWYLSFESFENHWKFLKFWTSTGGLRLPNFTRKDTCTLRFN